MEHDSHAIPPTEGVHGSLQNYVIGFIASIILTMASYVLVSEKLLAGFVLTFAVVTLGVIQMAAQLIFFLHLGSESKPRWNLLLFLFMAMVVVIIVGGSLWIMQNLDDNVMPMKSPTMDLKHQKVM